MTNRQGVTLTLWLGLLLLALWWAFNQTTVRSDLSLFLPAGANPVQRLLLEELNAGPATRLLLLAIEDGTEDERLAASRSLAKALQQSELFARVENGSFSFDIIQEKPLFGYRYLLSSNIDRDAFTAQRMQQALKRRLQELQAPLPSPFKPLLPADPTGEYQSLLRQWLPKSRPHLSQGVWSSEDGSRALLVVQTHASAFALDNQQQAIEMIQRSFQTLGEKQRLNLIISGPGAFGVQSRALIQSETRSLSLLSSAGVMLLLFIAYRSKRYLIIAIAPLASALLAGIFFTGLLFGELHGITLAFGITLLGITIDYPLHLFSHLRPGESADTAVQRIWRTLRLGVITTCIGYLVLITTDFAGLQQLGVFTVAGLIAAALSSRLILPILITRNSQSVRLAGMHWLPAMLRPTIVLSRLILAIGLLTAISLFFTPTSIWQDDIGALTPTSAAIISQDRELRAQLRAPEPNQLVIINAKDLETTLQHSERLNDILQTLVEQGAIGGFDSASRYLPSIRTQLERRAGLPTAAVMQDRLNAALADLPFRKDAFTAFISSLDESRRLAPLTLEDLADTPPGMRLKALLRERRGEWLLMVPLSQVADGAAVTQLLQKQLPSAQYLNLRTETSRLVSGFRHQVMERLAIGGLVMLLVLGIGLKSLLGALQTMLPVILATLLTMGLLYWTGNSLTLFHLVSLMLVLGIGLDYSLFFGRSEEALEERSLTLHALLICALSTSMVFGVLSHSEIPVLHSIGQTVALGVIISFLTTFALSRKQSTATRSE